MLRLLNWFNTNNLLQGCMVVKVAWLLGLGELIKIMQSWAGNQRLHGCMVVKDLGELNTNTKWHKVAWLHGC